MRKLVLMTILTLCHAAFGASENVYDIRVDYKDKANNSSSHVLVTPGKVSTILNRANGMDQFIDVDAKESKEVPDSIAIKLVTGTLDRQGNRTVINTHEVVTKNNESKQISVDADKGSDATSITVQPTRRTM